MSTRERISWRYGKVVKLTRSFKSAINLVSNRTLILSSVPREDSQKYGGMQFPRVLKR